jgi:hypothetical protein
MRRAALAVVLVASSARAEPVEIRCEAAVDRAELMAALALELHGGDPPAIAIDALPCEARSPVRVTLGDETTELAVPKEIRARAIALLVAELVSVRPRAPAPIAIAALPAPDVRAEHLDPPPLGAPATRLAPDGTEIAVMFVRRSYDHPDQNANGARVVVGTALPLGLRGSFDAGADQIATPYGFDMIAGRIGGSLARRFGVMRRLVLEVGVRGELAGARVRPVADAMLDRRWLGAVGGGVTLAALVDVSASLRVRIELEAARIAAAQHLEMGWTAIEAAPTAQRAFTGSVALSLGLTIR